MNPQHYSKQLLTLIITLAALALTAVILWSIPRATNRLRVQLVMILIVLLGMHYRNLLGIYGKALLTGLMLGCIVIYGSDAIHLMRANIAQPPEFDITLFWLHGRVAAQGLNFYESEHALSMAQPFHPSETMISELHFWYPPPTIFLFLPLGILDLQTATTLWYAVNTIFLIMCIFLLWRLFLREDGWTGLVFAATLLLMFHPTLSTILFGQLNFIVLLLILLFWPNREHMRSGIWLALAILSKLYMSIVLLYLTLQRKWKTLTVTILTLLISFVFVTIIFGPTTTFSYFTLNPAANAPNSVFLPGAVSLSGMLYRYGVFEDARWFTVPLYIVPTLILLIVSGWLIYLLDRQYEGLALALTLPLALLLYPITGEHYCVVLLIPFLLLWSYRQKIKGGGLGISLFIALEYTIFRNHSWMSNFTFFAVFLVWLVLVIIGFWTLKQQTIW